MIEFANCKVCGKEVSPTATICPHCGQSEPGLQLACPKCKSMNIASQQKGFGTVKAIIGAVLLGPFGLLAGMIGRKKIEMFCQSCGNRWIP